MATARQIASNRSNAQLSTGPTSDEGKARSRRNALTHGLAGDGPVLHDAADAAVERRLDDWRSGYAVETDEQEWLLRQMVASSVQVDRCQSEAAAVAGSERLRARVCWDDDRACDAEEAAATLSRRPALVVKRLRRDAHGCAWLIERWRVLLAVVERGESWSETQAQLAMDLLGLPPGLRDNPPWDDDNPPAVVASRELGRLERLKADGLDDLDDLEREATVSGVPLRPSKALERLRRYEAAALRRFQWARDRLSRLAEPVRRQEEPAHPPLPPHKPEPTPLPSFERSPASAPTPVNHSSVTAPLAARPVNAPLLETPQAPSSPTVPATPARVLPGFSADRSPTVGLNRRERRAVRKLARQRR